MTHTDYTALLARCWQQWPELRRYATTARRGGLRFDEQAGRCVYSENSVTITVTSTAPGRVADDKSGETTGES